MRPVFPRLPLLLLVLAGCAHPRPCVIIGADPGVRMELGSFLATHPLGAAEDLKAVPVGAIATTSYAIVQVRTRERAHLHADHDLTIHVLQGTGWIILLSAPSGSMFVGSAQPLGPGDLVSIPRGTIHWFVNTGREPAVALACFTPPYDGHDLETTPNINAMDAAVMPELRSTRLAPGTLELKGGRPESATFYSVETRPAGGP